MKKLRILFLAVLAMALMASGAFAASLSVGESSTIANLSEATEVTVTLTLDAAATENDGTNATITVAGFDESVKIELKGDGDDNTEITSSAATFTINVAKGSTEGTATLILTNVSAKEGADGNAAVTIALACSDPSVTASLAITKVSAPVELAGDGKRYILTTDTTPQENTEYYTIEEGGAVEVTPALTEETYNSTTGDGEVYYTATAETGPFTMVTAWSEISSLASGTKVYTLTGTLFEGTSFTSGTNYYVEDISGINSITLTSGEKALPAEVTVSVDKTAEVTVEVALVDILDSEGTEKVIISADAGTKGIASLSVGTAATVVKEADADTATWKGTIKITGVKSGDTTVTIKARVGTGAADEEVDAASWKSATAFTVKVRSKDVTVDDGGDKGGKISFFGVSVDKTAVPVSVDKTATVTFTVSFDASVEVKNVSLDVTSSSTDVATVKAASATTTAGKEHKFTVTVTGVKAGTATVKLVPMLSQDKKFASNDKYVKTVTVTVTGGTDDSGTTTTTSPDIALAEVSSLQERTVTLYVSGDAATYSIKLVASADYANADFSFDVDPEPSAWKFSAKEGTSTTSGDDEVIPYTLTFTPSETKSQDKTYYTMTAYIVGSDDISSSIKFYVEVLVSSDTTSGEGGTTPETSDAELAMEEPEVGTEELMQGGKTTVTITATPQAALGTYTFDYDDADDVFTITAGDEKQVSSVTGNAVEFTVQADIDAATGTHVVTFTVTSGDQEVSADVEFTVSALDLSDMDDAEKAQYIKDNPAPAPQDLTSAAQKEANRQAFAAGTGEAKFRFQSEWPVKTTGWRLRFMRGTVRFVLLDFMRWLFGGQYYYNEASVIAALNIAVSADTTDAITVSVEDETTAEYTVDVEKTAKGLNNGEEFAVTPAIIPEAYADVTGVDDADKESAGESVGTMKGTKTSGGGEQGGGEQGGDEGGDEGKEAIDNLLGGTSGGCDAGFGALALALAASMIFVRKRS